MIFYYLIMMHLTGDFLLQPKKLVDWKIRSKWGTAFHVLIHTVVGLVILTPFLINGYFLLIYVVLGINFIHFWIDEAKINYALTHDNKLKPFIIDQVLHFIVLAVVYFSIMKAKFELPTTEFYDLYTNPNNIKIALAIILLASILNIVRFRKD